MTEATTETTTETAAPPSDSLLAGLPDAPAAPADTNGRPAGLPDEFWNAEKNAPEVDKIWEAYTQANSRAEGLRKKLSRGEFEGKAPEDVKEYTLELDESLKAIVPDDDPLLAAAREAAKQAGLPKEAFAKFITPVIEEIAKMKPEEPTEEDMAVYRAQELEKLGPNGARIAANVKAFVGELEAKGVFLPEDTKVAQGMITNADHLRVFNRLRAAMGNTQDVPMENVTTGQISKLELQSKLVEAANKNDEALYNEIAAQLHKLA